MEQSQRWQTVPGFELLLHTWGDGEYLVYHTGSGDTHLLDDVAAAVLQRLGDVPASSRELSAVPADALGLPPDEALVFTGELLEELRRLGLVEQIP